MFIVYSPEGQSFVGSVQQLPVLRIDPAKRINKVNKSELESLDVENFQLEPNNPALKAYKKNQQPSRRVIVKASELMSNPVIAINFSESIENAWSLMQSEDIKHLPVMERGELVGMCTQANILTRIMVDKKGDLENTTNETVADIMNPSIVTTAGSTEVRYVAQALMGFEIDALVVMDDYQQVAGIITRSDLIGRLANEPPIELYT